MIIWSDKKVLPKKYNKNERLVSTANLGFYSDYFLNTLLVKSLLSFMQLYLQ